MPCHRSALPAPNLAFASPDLQYAPYWPCPHPRSITLAVLLLVLAKRMSLAMKSANPLFKHSFVPWPFEQKPPVGPTFADLQLTSPATFRQRAASFASTATASARRSAFDPAMAVTARGLIMRRSTCECWQCSFAEALAPATRSQFATLFQWLAREA